MGILRSKLLGSRSLVIEAMLADKEQLGKGFIGIADTVQWRFLSGD